VCGTLPCAQIWGTRQNTPILPAQLNHMKRKIKGKDSKTVGCVFVVQNSRTHPRATVLSMWWGPTCIPIHSLCLSASPCPFICLSSSLTQTQGQCRWRASIAPRASALRRRDERRRGAWWVSVAAPLTGRRSRPRPRPLVGAGGGAPTEARTAATAQQ
jgi:hypothetical protein